MRIVWQGGFFRQLSLDRVNREIVWELMRDRNIDIKIQPIDPIPERRESPESALVALSQGIEPADIHVRHQWPPVFSGKMGPLWLFQPWEFGGIPKEWVAPIRRTVSRVLVPSSAVKIMYVDGGIPESLVDVVPLGVNPLYFRPAGPIARVPEVREHVLLYVGGLLPRKGIDLLLKAYGRAFHQNDPVSLIVKVGGQEVYDGSSYRTMLANFVSDSNHPHVVVMDHDFSDVQLAALYRRATALVHPFRGEGFGLPIIEAMACGTPAVVSKTGPALDFVSEETGYLVDGQRRLVETEMELASPGYWFEPDVDLLSHVLQRAISDGKKKGEQASRDILQDWTWAHSAKKFSELINDDRKNISHAMMNIPRQVPQLIWRGPYTDASGYASEARDWIKEFSRRGFVLRLIDDTFSKERVISQAEEQLFSTLEHVQVDPSAPMIHMVPRCAFFPRNQGVDIGRTMFETDRLPAGWIERCNSMDKLMVPAEFSKRIFIDAGIASHKIYVIPEPVNLSEYTPDGIRLSDPKLAGRFVFLSVFDWSLRKGWDILFHAWAKAFSSDAPVILLIKVNNFLHTPDQILKDLTTFLQKLGTSRERLAPVEFLFGPLTTQNMAALYRTADAFVLPTRGEGWGRPIIEAMASGLPVIATDWSAMTDYLTEDNSLPLLIEGLEDVPSDFPIKDYHGHRWARPSVDHLVELLRKVVESQHQPEIQRIRENARETAHNYDPATIIKKVVDEVL